jgi:hypothetical protein
MMRRNLYTFTWLMMSFAVLGAELYVSFGGR